MSANWHSGSILCRNCHDVDSKLVDGLCRDCFAYLNRCGRCGTYGKTRPFRLFDGEKIGLDGVSHFCEKCAAEVGSGYREVAA